MTRPPVRLPYLIHSLQSIYTVHFVTSPTIIISETQDLQRTLQILHYLGSSFYPNLLLPTLLS